MKRVELNDMKYRYPEIRASFGAPAVLVGMLIAVLPGCTKGNGTVSDNWTPDTPSMTAQAPGGYGPSSDAGVQSLPYQAPSVDAYMGKVKNLLTGLPPTAAEISAVTANPSALKSMVGGWMQLPQYQPKMMDFFGNAFQQTLLVPSDFENQQAPRDPDPSPLLFQNLRESFARTAIQLIAAGRPFTETMTTDKFMMTVPMMSYYALLDAQHIDDSDRLIDRFVMNDAGFTFTLTSSASSVSIADSIDPNNPNYMTWYAPQLATSYDQTCGPVDPITFTNSTIFGGIQEISAPLYRFLIGNSFQFYTNPPILTASGVKYICSVGLGASPVFTSADYTTWQMVTVRKPNAGETPTRFFDIPTLRTTNELVLTIPRVGFFTTPAFFAGWQTNASNQNRVTMNQTLIVGLGHAFDGTDTIAPLSLAAVDSAHAPSNSACYSCHETLDPMRQFFRQAYTVFGHEQLSAAETMLPGMFAFDGVSVAGTGIADLGTQLAQHPRFATAWTQKLCTYANSAPCSETDPEFLRIVQVFVSSNYSWNALVQELFSSPIVTYAQDTQTADQIGEVFPVARRDHLCVSLSNRLGINDVCGLNAETTVPKALKPVQVIATALPSDQYSRGAVEPVLANDPSLFFRAGLENICIAVSNVVVDGGATSKYSSSDPTAAIADFVHNLMGVGPDRDSTPLSILQGHFQKAMAAGASATNALKSTFVVACLSPTSAGIGQ